MCADKIDKKLKLAEFHREKLTYLCAYSKNYTIRKSNRVQKITTLWMCADKIDKKLKLAEFHREKLTYLCAYSKKCTIRKSNRVQKITTL